MRDIEANNINAKIGSASNWNLATFYFQERRFKDYCNYNSRRVGKKTSVGRERGGGLTFHGEKTRSWQVNLCSSLLTRALLVSPIRVSLTHPLLTHFSPRIGLIKKGWWRTNHKPKKYPPTRKNPNGINWTGLKVNTWQDNLFTLELITPI